MRKVLDFAHMDHLTFQDSRYVLPPAKTTQLNQEWIPEMQPHLSPTL